MVPTVIIPVSVLHTVLYRDITASAEFAHECCAVGAIISSPVIDSSVEQAVTQGDTAFARRTHDSCTSLEGVNKCRHTAVLHREGIIVTHETHDASRMFSSFDTSGNGQVADEGVADDISEQTHIVV